MRREFLLYLIDRPILTVSLLFSSMPLWFVLLYAIYKEYDVIFTLLGLLVVFLSKINSYTDPVGLNPFLVALNTFIKMVSGFVFQIAILIFLIGLSILMAIGETEIAAVVGILLLIVIVVMFLTLNGRILARLWGIRVLDENRGVLLSIFYNLMWVIVFFNDDPVMFVFALLISFYINLSGFYKRVVLTI